MNTPTILPDQKKIGMVSLGCPKALVDSERILTRLRADGYAFAEDYAGADVVLVNTCGFLDSAKEESLAAIGEAIAENGRVIVTGCMGEEADAIRAAHPSVLAVTGAGIIQLLQAERLVECFEAASWSGGAEDAALMAMAEPAWEASHVPPPEGVAGRLGAIRCALDDFLDQWRVLPEGGALHLEWPAMAGDRR